MKSSALTLLGKLSFLSPEKRFELYPPFFFMRIKVLEMDPHWDRVRIKLPLNWLSRNFGGNMFGGYQSSLADPVPAFACGRNFSGYRMVTKSLTLDFIRPGNSDLVLHFDFDPAQKQQIRAELDANKRADAQFEMAYYRQDGKICTHVRNTVAIREPGYRRRE